MGVDFPGGSVVKNPPVNAGEARDAGSIQGSGRSPGEWNGNPLQYSCWEFPWIEEPGRLQSMRSQSRQDWATECTHSGGCWDLLVSQPIKTSLIVCEFPCLLNLPPPSVKWLPLSPLLDLHVWGASFWTNSFAVKQAWTQILSPGPIKWQH